MDYDKKMLLWPEVRKNGGLESILRDKADVKFWTRIFDMVYAGRIQTWAHQLTFSSWVNSRLSIIPNVNLVSNIGFNRPDATNTIKAVPYAGLSLSKMVFPLRHPKEMIPDLEADRYTARQQFSLRPFPVRVFNKLWAILVSMRALFRLHVQLKGERSFVMHFLKVFRRTVCEIAYFFSQFHAPKSLGRKVLLLRLDHLGDFLIFSAVIKEYRKLFSDYKFFLILDEHLMSLAKKLNGIDEVIPFAGRRFGQNLIYRIRLLNRIRAESFEVVVDPHCSRSEASALVTRFSNAKERIGFATDTVNISADEKRRTDSFYTRLVSVPQNLPELQKHQRLLSLLGVPTNNLIPQLNLSEAELHRAEVLLERNGIKHKTPHFVIAPGASVEYRCWPGLKYSEFITRLSKAGGRVVLVGSPGERSLCADIIAKSSVPALNLAGQTDLISAAGVLKLSRGVLSNESGPVHLAAAVRVPVVCVMGGGYPGRFFPYGDLSRNVVVQRRMECFGCGWHCKYWSRGRKNSVPCIADIEVADVFNAFSEFL